MAKKRAKLSIHAQSQRPQTPRISTEAMKVFGTCVQRVNIAVDVAAVREGLGETTPTATEFINAWREVLTEDRVSNADARGLIEQIPALMEQYPVPNYDADELPVGVIRIEDLKKFKAALQISDPPRPLVEWNDLPTPNL